jgi:hypothetical protein
MDVKDGMLEALAAALAALVGLVEALLNLMGVLTGASRLTRD